MSSKLRVLFFDLETAPLLAHVWGPREDWIPHERMLHDSFVLTWSAKWWGKSKVHTDVLTGQEARAQDDFRIIASLANLMHEADFVVAHNGDNFDVPHVNTRLLVNGQLPVSVKSLDTCKIAKQTFRFAYNKLDYLAAVLFNDHKIKTEFKWWLDCYHGDEQALAKMSRYNVKDVRLLERVFDALLPYGKGIPRLVSATVNGEHACPFCGSKDVQKRGFHHTNVSVFQKYQCNDCSRYSRSRKAEPAKLQLSPL